ncbi:MAG: hypothetical protein ACLTR6_15155 [Clostridium fessum]
MQLIWTIPDKMVGRAMADLECRFAVFEGPWFLEDGQADTTTRNCTGFIPGWIWTLP